MNACFETGEPYPPVLDFLAGCEAVEASAEDVLYVIKRIKA